MRPDRRSFRAEFKRLRASARSEGRDPYAPVVGYWVPAVERLRRSRQPRERNIGALMARCWEDVIRRRESAIADIS